ncbi:MAG: bifunctional DNA-formamidopyrimidine glycosylase/DNA-(apurinic or apyrimidinic site) lyase [Gammaproteobacteria bacterium]
MPELPEVETTRRGITPYIEGKRIREVIIRQPVLRWPVTDGIDKQLAGLLVESTSRRGKYLLLKTSCGTVIMHLGMSGSLRIVPYGSPPGKHDHIDFIFEDHTDLRLNDPRRFGSVLWTTAPASEHPLLKNLGLEPLSADFNGEYLYAVSRNRTAPVKTLIMDSHIVVGVGNIYANEALFLAGIKPSRQSGTIALSRYRKLAESIRFVLERSIEQGGTTLRNFVNESGKPGYFKQQLAVYGRGGQTCNRCRRPLIEARISNRSTVYCKHCQR